MATTAAQFSMWKKNGGIIPSLSEKSSTQNDKKPHNPLHQGLCPPQKPNQPFWRDDTPSLEENNIWTNTMRIATEAILYPEQFKKRTTEVDGFHYTSGMAERKKADEEKAKKLGKKFKDSDKTLPRGARFIEKMKQSHPSIEGRSIEQDACLEVWKE